MSTTTSNRRLTPDERAALCSRVDFLAILAEDGCDVRREGNRHVTRLREERTPSCHVYPPGIGKQGHRGWTVHDYGSGLDVDALGYLIEVRHMGFADALCLLRARTGTGTTARIAMPRLAPRPEAVRRELPESMPPDVASAWDAGREHILADAGERERIAASRGWPARLVETLADDGHLAMPLYGGARSVAWRVDRPDGACGSYSPRPIGYHVRVSPPVQDQRAKWKFHPQGKLEALPVVWGDFPAARLIVIAEGQWDAATFGLAAGWFDGNASWPDDVAVVGIRGASGILPFIRRYAPLWPPEPPVALLLCDNDAAGRTWTTDAGFAHDLAKLCRRVKAAEMREGWGKDFNEAHRLRQFTPEEIRSALVDLGIVNSKGKVI